MLEELHVSNLGLLADARIEPGPGLVAVTGETGTGKTLLLGALRLLIGESARTDRIGPDGDEAVVEGRFSTDGVETTVARRVAAGRSRAYLDGAMAPNTALEERLAGSVEIVAQHEHTALGQEAVVRGLVDGVLDAEGVEARASYRAAWKALVALRRDRDSLGGDPKALARDLDLARHEAREIEAAGLDPDAEDALRSDLQRLRHAGEIQELLAGAHAELTDEQAGIDRIRTAVQGVVEAAELDPTLEGLAARLRGLATELDEAADDVRAGGEDVEHDPGALQAAEERMAAIRSLQRKYGDSVADVIAYGIEAADRADRLAGLVERSETIGAEIEAAEHAVDAAAEALHAARRRAAKELSERAAGHLRQLGFGDPVIDIAVERTTPAASGGDRITLKFASEAALTPAPVSRIASGGELSRLVLAIRLAAGAGEAAIIAFDEIDAGIGGTTALAMGEKLAALADGRQVLVVTHLPQVAAFADTHIVVERSGTTATVRTVTGPDRIEELTRMLGGLAASERGQSHAEELLELAAGRRS